MRIPVGLNFPPSNFSSTLSALTAGGIDLGPCLGLRDLHFRFRPSFSQKTYYSVVKHTLNSWKPGHPSRLEFAVDNGHKFTREGYANVLRTASLFVDTWIQEAAPPGNAEHHRCAYCRLIVHIDDSGVWRQWWWDCIQRCFPTWERLGWLTIHFQTCE